MAVGAPTLRTRGTNANAAASFNGATGPASFTPAANALVIVGVVSERSGGPNAPTLTGHNITWTQIATQVFGTNFRITAFRGSSATPNSTALTIAFGGQVQDGCAWSIYEFSGQHATTPIVQSPTNSGTGTAASVALSALGTGDAFTVLVGVADNVPITPGTGWTEIDDVPQNTRDYEIETQYRLTDADGAASWAGSLAWGAIGVEIAQAGGAAAALAGTATLTLGATAALTTAIRLTASPTLALSATAALTTGITLAASSTLALTATGALTTAIPLAGSATLALGATGDLTAGPLPTTALAFMEWDLVWEPGIPLAPTEPFSQADQQQLIWGHPAVLWTSAEIALSGTATLSLAATGSLTTQIALAGASTLALSATGSLTTAIPLVGASTLALAASGSLTTGIALSGSASLSLSASGELAGAGAALAGTATLSLGATGALTTAIRLTGASTLALGATGSLTGVAAALTGAATLSLGATGVLTTGIALSGAASLSLGATGGLTTAIRLAGTSTLTLTASGMIHLGALDIVGEIVLLRYDNSPVLLRYDGSPVPLKYEDAPVLLRTG